MKNIISVLAILALTGCANSASHEVVTTTKTADSSLTCSEIRVEKAHMASIIDGVEQDKKDMTGSDVVDGLLWFPFNVMAKQSNYTNAVKAAQARLEHLNILEAEKKCKK